MTHLISSPGSQVFLALCLAGWFLLVNSMTVAAFRIDRRRAKAGEWRVPKRTLLMLVTLGGWPGAKLTQLMSRHKLHRRPFRMMMDLSIVPLAILAVYLVAIHPAQEAMAVAYAAPQPEPASTTPTPAGPEVFNLTQVSATAGSVVVAAPDLPKQIVASSTEAALH